MGSMLYTIVKVTIEAAPSPRIGSESVHKGRFVGNAEEEDVCACVSLVRRRDESGRKVVKGQVDEMVMVD